MLEGKDRCELEQSMALLSEVLPRCWRGLYDGMIEQGFTEDQAMKILRSCVYGQSRTASG